MQVPGAPRASELHGRRRRTSPRSIRVQERAQGRTVCSNVVHFLLGEVALEVRDCVLSLALCADPELWAKRDPGVRNGGWVYTCRPLLIVAVIVAVTHVGRHRELVWRWVVVSFAVWISRWQLEGRGGLYAWFRRLPKVEPSS